MAVPIAISSFTDGFTRLFSFAGIVENLLWLLFILKTHIPCLYVRSLSEVEGDVSIRAHFDFTQ